MDAAELCGRFITFFISFAAWMIFSQFA